MGIRRDPSGHTTAGGVYMKIKNWFKKSFSKSQMTRFFKRYGAITAGITCAAIVGIVYAVTWNGSQSPSIEPTPSPGFNNDQQSGLGLDERLSDIVNPFITPEPQATKPAPTPVTAGVQAGIQHNTSPIPKMLRPVDGKIIVSFARDTLVYSETLRQWATHSGIDIEAEEGTDVVAVLDGVVEDIVEDEMMGICVFISHKNDMRSVYCALLQTDVSIDDEVSRGDVIGQVGNTAICEMASGDHLHFEFYLGDTVVNAAPFFLDK